MAWFRADPTLTVGMGKGWQTSLQLPFDVRAISVEYLTMDGGPYDPPYDDIHHRNEVLWGLVDGSVLVRRYGATGRWVYGGGLGSSLPFGRTEEDPYALTEQGLTHQHMQLGSGTFVPLATADVMVMGARWGGMAWISGRLPLYTNGKGYRPPASASLGAGPTFRITPKAQVLGSVEGLYEGAEFWAEHPYGGRTALMAGGSALYSLGPDLVLQAQARGTILQHNETHEDPDGELTQPIILTAGVSWTIGR